MKLRPAYMQRRGAWPQGPKGISRACRRHQVTGNGSTRRVALDRLPPLVGFDERPGPEAKEERHDSEGQYADDRQHAAKVRMTPEQILRRHPGPARVLGARATARSSPGSARYAR